MMPLISFRNVSLDLPVFNANGRSLTSRFLEVATGGRLDADPQGKVVVRALDTISFDVRDGERVALLGHNGAGKSSLLRMISGVYEPTTGDASVNGTVGSLIDVALGINPEATGRENVFIRGALLGLSKKEIRLAYDEIVAFSELGDFIHMPVRTYSSGMHLRLAFAVSTVVRPEILVMDEWLSVGDESFRLKAEKRLGALVDSTRGLVLASHSRALIEATCTRAIWLEHGKILLDGPTEEVVRQYFGAN